MRICMVHQPHFLPWPGYLARCLSVDILVVLDDVKFNRNHFQHRTKFIDRNGELKWLSLPIDHATRSLNITDVRIAKELQLKKWERPILESYRQAPFFDKIWSNVALITETARPQFCDVAVKTLEFTLRGLVEAAGSNMPQIIRSSTLDTQRDRSARLVDICNHLHATHLVMGGYALRSHDIELMVRSGIRLMGQDFVGAASEMPPSGVMGLHYIMHEGFQSVFGSLMAHWALRDMEV